jgi:hypothetical protein
MLQCNHSPSHSPVGCRCLCRIIVLMVVVGRRTISSSPSFFASSLFSFQCSHCRFTLEWCLTNVSSSEGGKKRGNCRGEQHGGLSGIATTLRIRWNSSAFSCRNELWETAERARHDSQPARSIISQRPRH